MAITAYKCYINLLWVKIRDGTESSDVRSQMYLPVVEAAFICQFLINGAVDGGLSSFPGIFDYPHEDGGYSLLPQS